MPRDDLTPDADPSSPSFETLPLEILTQPTDTSCGPTSLHAVYNYWGHEIELDAVIESVQALEGAGLGGGTLAVMLGIDALKRGFSAHLKTFNLQVFDPSWFDYEGRSRRKHLEAKLRAQAEFKAHEDPRFAIATEAYLEFLERGGVISSPTLSGRLITSYIRKGVPLLTGLSATYLYRCPREFGPDDAYDDVRGTPSGHFVVLHGYDRKHRRVLVSDPLADNPAFEGHRYSVSMARLVPSIMLGVVTFDANLLAIEPTEKEGEASR